MECAIIFNPSSGKKKLPASTLEKIQHILFKKGYNATLYITRYSGHATEIAETLDDVDLIVSIGGDGTFDEVVKGNLNKKKTSELLHLPMGTTNDLGAMLGLGKSPIKNLERLLEGESREVDIATVNGEPFVYVAGFGRFVNVPYETSRDLKKKIGYLAYIYEAVKDFFLNTTSMHEITYEVGEEKYHGLYSFALVSNANRIAGINNFYKDVYLDDGKVEILFCNLKTKKEIIQSLLYLRKNDITQVPGFYYHKAKEIKITFHNKLNKAWCVDGEKLKFHAKTYHIKVDRKVTIRVPNTSVDSLFKKGRKR